MDAHSILRRESLRDLYLAHIAVEEGLVPAPVAAEICLTSFLRPRGRSSIVPELLAVAGGFSAARVHWLDAEVDRQLLAGTAEAPSADPWRHAGSRVLPGARSRAGRPHEVIVTPTVVRPMPVGRYTDFVLRAQGGSGLVYFTWDCDMARWVAMKLLRPRAAHRDLGDPLALAPPTEASALQEFQRDYDAFLGEARRMGSMMHPGILDVFEVGETPQGVPYYTMPRGTGLTLRDALAEGTPADLDGLDVLTRVADAVGHAHEGRGLVHCDLNPGNVMLGRHGEVFVLDWAEARRVGNWASRHGVPAAGTPGWVAPELRKDACRIHATLDVYALGAMLFHVLTGRVPFPGQAHVLVGRSAPDARVLPPTDLIPAADQRLSDLCMRCLATEPDRRPPNALEVARLLREARAGRRTP